MQGITNSAGSIIGLNSDLTLLWENPNPTSAFSAQTITVNWSKFRYLAVEAGVQTDNFGHKNITIINDFSENYITATDTNSTRSVTRKVTCNSDKSSIIFGEGYSVSGSVNNSLCIPLAIYGCNNASIEESPTTGLRFSATSEVAGSVGIGAGQRAYVNFAYTFNATEKFRSAVISFHGSNNGTNTYSPESLTCTNQDVVIAGTSAIVPYTTEPISITCRGYFQNGNTQYGQSRNVYVDIVKYY